MGPKLSVRVRFGRRCEWIAVWQCQCQGVQIGVLVVLLVGTSGYKKRFKLGSRNGRVNWSIIAEGKWNFNLCEEGKWQWKGLDGNGKWQWKGLDGMENDTWRQRFQVTSYSKRPINCTDRAFIVYIMKLSRRSLSLVVLVYFSE